MESYREKEHWMRYPGLLTLVLEGSTLECKNNAMLEKRQRLVYQQQLTTEVGVVGTQRRGVDPEGNELDDRIKPNR